MNIKDSQGIYAELLEENTIMREKLRDRDSIHIESLSTFTIEDLKDKLKISGVLLAPGIHKGKKYNPTVIKAMYNDFKNELESLDISVEHEKDTEYKKKNVGTIDKVEWNDKLKSILYSGTITDKNAINDIKGGRFGATSMRLRLKQENGICTFIKPESPNTLTQFPACKKCEIFATEELSDKIKYIIKEDLNIGSPQHNKKGYEMKDELTQEEELRSLNKTLKDLIKIIGTEKESQFVTKFDTDEDSEFSNLIKTSMKDKSLRASVLEWNKTHETKEESKEEKTNCPIDNEEFTKEEFSTHWEKEHSKLGTVEQYKTRTEKLSKMTLSEIEKELESSKCPFCNELVVCLTEHNKECKVRTEVMAEKVICKVKGCGKDFENYAKFIEHWNAEHKDKYGSYGKKDEEEKQSEEKEEEKKESKEEEKKEEKKEETKEEAKEPEKKEEEKKEEGKEEIEEVKEEEKKETEKDAYTQIKEAEGNTLDKTTALIIKGLKK